jgi:hypothetical protein
VETLAPKDTKRHPKKLPPYCWQQQQHHHQPQQHQLTTSIETHSNDSHKLLPPQFLIRGIEIADHKANIHPTSVTLPDDYIDDEVDVIDVISENNSNLLPIDFNANTTINNNMAKNNQNDDNASVNVSPTDCLINWDDYEMDNYGHLPGCTRTPTPIPTIFRPSFSLRTPSPNTRQIIRVAVKMNREKRENEKNKFNVMDSKIMINNRDVRDKKGRIRCGNAM